MSGLSTNFSRAEISGIYVIFIANPNAINVQHETLFNFLGLAGLANTRLRRSYSIVMELVLRKYKQQGRHER